MLRYRIITALILLAIVWLMLFKATPAIFAAGAWLLCMVAIYELVVMYKFNFVQIVLLLVADTLIALSLSNTPHDISQIIRIISVLTWCFIIPLVLIFIPQNFSKWLIAIFSILLFIPAYYALTLLHQLLGAWQILSIMAIAWVADTGAYFVGKLFGKHKLAPQISPGKSIEGAIGGFVLVLLYLIGLKQFNLTYYLPNYLTVFKFALIVTIISIMGDLFESWLKRVAKVKDSSNLLPGHGGVFDRIDSLIAVLAISFAIIRGMI